MARKNGGTAVAEAPEQEQAEDAPQAVEAVKLPEVLDDEAVKGLTVEQIASMSLYQLAGLDMRHDLLTADQSKAVADAIAAASKATVKVARKVARQKERGENLVAWDAFVQEIGPMILAEAESGMHKRVSRVAVCVTQAEDGTLDFSTRLLKARQLLKSETPYEIPQSETDQGTPGEPSESPESDSE